VSAPDRLGVSAPDRLGVVAHELRSPVAALVAAGNVGGDGEREAVSAYLDDPDDATREVAAWALARLEERDA